MAKASQNTNPMSSVSVPVIPLRPDKAPLCSHGVKDAKPFGQWPPGSTPPIWGFACGEPSGICVVDADNAEARAWFEAAMRDNGADAKDFEGCVTPRGVHWYIKFDSRLGNCVKIHGQVDTRSSGGYAAFCGRGSNGDYRLTGYGLDCLVPGLAAELPSGVMDLLAGKPKVLVGTKGGALSRVLPLGLSEDTLIEVTLVYRDACMLDGTWKYGTWCQGLGMALHHETGGSVQGLGVWDAVSQLDGGGYAGFDELEKHWMSFGRYAGKLVTMESILFKLRGRVEKDGDSGTMRALTRANLDQSGIGEMGI